MTQMIIWFKGRKGRNLSKNVPGNILCRKIIDFVHHQNAAFRQNCSCSVQDKNGCAKLCNDVSGSELYALSQARKERKNWNNHILYLHRNRLTNTTKFLQNEWNAMWTAGVLRRTDHRFLVSYSGLLTCVEWYSCVGNTTHKRSSSNDELSITEGVGMVQNQHHF